MRSSRNMLTCEKRLDDSILSWRTPAKVSFQIHSVFLSVAGMAGGSHDGLLHWVSEFSVWLCSWPTASPERWTGWTHAAAHSASRQEMNEAQRLSEVPPPLPSRGSHDTRVLYSSAARATRGILSRIPPRLRQARQWACVQATTATTHRENIQWPADVASANYHVTF